MHFVQAKCPNCAGNLEVDKRKEAAICDYCGTPFVVEKAVQQYNYHIDSAHFYMAGVAAKDFMIRGGILERYNGNDLDVLIPDKVFRIEHDVFSRMGIQSVSIPEGVVSIGARAFSDCLALKTADIPLSMLEIGAYAFIDSGLESIKIPDGVTKLGERAFARCPDLKTVTLPKSVKTLANYVFEGSGLTSLTIPGNITDLGVLTFHKCESLETVVIEEGVRSLGEATFEDCINLTSVTIPGSVEKLGDGTFKNCNKLKDVKLPDKLPDQQISAAFAGTAWLHDRIEKRALRRSKGLCQHCGDYFGFFSGKCKTCGRAKDY